MLPPFASEPCSSFIDGRNDAFENVRVEKRASVLRMLSDGEPHTALSLAQAIGASSAEIRTIVKYLEAHFAYNIARGRKGFLLKVNGMAKWQKTTDEQNEAVKIF